MRSGPPGFAADAGKTAHVGMRPCDCRKVSALPGEAERAVQQASRLIDLPERPQDHSQPARGNDSVIEDEPGGKMVIRGRGHRPRGLVRDASARRRNRPGTSKLRQRCAIRGSAGRHARKPPPPRASSARSARTKLTIHMP